MPTSPESSPFESPDPEPPGSPRRRMARRGNVNFLLIAGSVLVALFSAMGENTGRLLPLFISEWPARSPEALLEVRHGEIWRLFTPAFLHFGVMHLAFNMLAMVNLGDPLERVQGWRFYLTFTATVALCSNLGQYFVSGQPSFGGMSGVIFGLFGFIWLRGRCDPDYLLRLPLQAIVTTLLWFAFCLTGVLPIANTAHGVGLGIGVVWGAVSGLQANRRARAVTPPAPTTA